MEGSIMRQENFVLKLVNILVAGSFLFKQRLNYSTNEINDFLIMGRNKNVLVSVYDKSNLELISKFLLKKNTLSIRLVVPLNI